MNRAARCAAVRAAIVVLTAIVALLGAPATGAAAARGPDGPAPASSIPAEAPGEAAQHIAEPDLPLPVRRTERRGVAGPRAVPLTAVPPHSAPPGAVLPAAAPPTPDASRSLVLRC
ncbi:hypothetical protein [Streptomyces sp. NPDC059828]|uniref:hypothetical protein n=1 Tax=Streptomyces sp. NPDC059828 TaxID=3346965 RepID=UPI003667B99F